MPNIHHPPEISSRNGLHSRGSTRGRTTRGSIRGRPLGRRGMERLIYGQAKTADKVTQTNASKSMDMADDAAKTAEEIGEFPIWLMGM